jgi:hypothetical protein
MRKTLLLLSFLLTSLMTFAATNLTSGKTVYPLGGLKAFLPEGSVTTENLQKITVDDNTSNVFLFPENGANLDYNKTLGIQGFYIDLGEVKSIGAIQSTWEGADCGANIYVTNTAPAADGSLTGETLIGTFTNAQEGTKNIGVTVSNSGRYIVFVPTEATNFAWGVKIRTFVALEKEASVLTSLDVTPTMVKVGEATAMTFTAKDQIGVTLTEGVTYTATNATLVGTMLTATAVGDVKITATYNAVSVDKIIQAIDVSAPTTNPTEPTDLAANVIAIYSAKYEKGINESNPGWGVGGGAPNPLYTSVEEVEIAGGHKVVHVNGAGFNSRTAGAVGITSDYTKIHVAVYPFTATEAKIFGDNGYGKAVSKTGLTPGQWNYIELDNDANYPNYVLIELVGESEFYLDHFYFAKPAVDDDEAPVLNTAAVKSAGIGSVTFTLKATDNKSAKVTYVINDGTKNYTTKGDSGVEITYTIGDLDFGKEYTFSIIAKDDNENASDAQNVNATTLALTAAPVPDKDAAAVISLYSNAYTAASTYTYGKWGQSTIVGTETVSGDEMLKLNNYNYLGFELATQLDLKDMEYVHIDVLPMQDMSVGITPIMTGGTPTENSTSIGALTAGEWNSKDIKLSDLGLDFANYKAFQLKIDGGKGETVYVDNIYFWKGGDPDALVINAPNAQDIVTVSGKITDANKATVEALTDAMIDLSGATIEATTLSITGNPNAVVVVAGTVGEGNVATTTQTAVAGNRVVKNGAYYFPVEQLQFVDNPKNALWTGFFISGNAAGWKYTRTLKANTFNTVVVPVGTTVPEGATAYELSAYDNGNVTFKEITGAMAGSQPYLVKVGGADVIIEIVSTGDFNIVVANEGATVKDGATFKANYKKQEMSDVYVLETGTTSATFKKAASANIGSCRAYLTGVAPAVAGSNIFIDLEDINGNVTGITSVKANNDKADGKFYNLQGQEVKDPAKGIFIVNGKKVVIK